MRKVLLTGIFSCLAFLLNYAQRPVVNATVDKSEILIGEQFKLKIQTNFSGDDFFIKWINMPDSLLHFELVNKSKIDSTFANEHLTGLSQTFTLTSFDSGKWNFPALYVNFNPLKSDTTLTILTDSLPITVSFSVADTTSALKDIKTIRGVEVMNPIWYWIGGAILILLLLLMGFWLYRRSKKNKKTVTIAYNLSPYEEAMQSLESLKQFDLSTAKELQQFHIKLVDTLRRFLSRKENNDYRNKTTGDILLAINNNYRDKEILTKAAAALRFSDAVKYAKYLPPASDSTANQQTIKDVIHLIESVTTKTKL